MRSIFILISPPIIILLLIEYYRTVQGDGVQRQQTTALGQCSDFDTNKDEIQKTVESLVLMHWTFTMNWRTARQAQPLPVIIPLSPTTLRKCCAITPVRHHVVFHLQIVLKRQHVKPAVVMILPRNMETSPLLRQWWITWKKSAFHNSLIGLEDIR